MNELHAVVLSLMRCPHWYVLMPIFMCVPACAGVHPPSFPSTSHTCMYAHTHAHAGTSMSAKTAAGSQASKKQLKQALKSSVHGLGHKVAAQGRA